MTARLEAQRESLAEAEQVQRRLETFLSSPRNLLAPEREAELRAEVARCRGELDALRRQYDVPRRKFFTPPMPPSWQEKLTELLHAQLSASEAADAASSTAAAASVAAAQLKARLSRVRSSAAALAPTWDPHSIMADIARTEAEAVSSMGNASPDLAVAAAREAATKVSELEALLAQAASTTPEEVAAGLAAVAEFVPKELFEAVQTQLSTSDAGAIRTWNHVCEELNKEVLTRQHLVEASEKLSADIGKAVDVYIERAARGEDVGSCIEELDELSTLLAVHGPTPEVSSRVQDSLKRAGVVS